MQALTNGVSQLRLEDSSTSTPPAIGVSSFKFGSIGIKLAEELPRFSLDVVGIIAGYLVNKDLGPSLRNETRLAPYGQPLTSISKQVLEDVRDFGPDATELDLISQKEPTDKDDPVPYRFGEEAVQCLVPHLPNLKKLKIDCTREALFCLLNNLPKLSHLELGLTTKKYEEDAFEDPRVAELAKKIYLSVTLKSGHVFWFDRHPLEPVVSEVRLIMTHIHFELSTYKMDKLETLRIHIPKDAAVDNMPQYSREWLIARDLRQGYLNCRAKTVCFENCPELTVHLIDRPRYNLKLIFKDCPLISEADCDTLRTRYPHIQVLREVTDGTKS